MRFAVRLRDGDRARPAVDLPLQVDRPQVADGERGALALVKRGGTVHQEPLAEKPLRLSQILLAS